MVHYKNVDGKKTKIFSSPSGDGLVLLEKKGYIKVAKYFRPRLGMGWFISISLYVIWFRDFRPRLGMGWFEYDPTRQWDYRIFSSPSGDGLVLTNNGYINRNLIFFVPEWGWVGSFFSLHENIKMYHFRPRLGMGWFKIVV